MVWSKWRGAVVVLFAWAGLAWTQGRAASTARMCARSASAGRVAG